ncbi:hypothetical protein PYW07_008671 [Mythimna separata]|uniref:SWIM-type domain-containing protein n=1 Tax=Mythimna separata TaxID=271217 RepID=A0AAD7YD42_MYTSE|nr:hypothetical protein PYW07_008671 [Mythimna separata]
MSNSSSTRIPVVAECVLNHVEKRITESENKQLLDEELLSLHSVFGAVLERALDILEKHPTFVAYTTTNKTRTLIEIQGENDRCYRVFPRINYCPCRSFKHQVLERKAQVLCKHVLAARIAQILGRTADHEVTQDQYLMLLRSMFNTDEHNG